MTVDPSLPLRALAALAAGLCGLCLTRIVLGWLAEMVGLTRARIGAERAERRSADRIFRGLGAAFAPLARAFPPAYLHRVETRLILAGRPHGGIEAGAYLAAITVFAAIGGGALALIAALLEIRAEGFSPGAVAAAGGLGFALTLTLGLSRLATEAELVGDAILKEFPFFLDLAILTVEAGGTPTQALRAYIEAAPETQLAPEIEIAARDAEASSIDQALLRMIPRIKPEPIRQILRNLAQAERTSGNVAQFYAEQAFELRAIRAEMAERARNSLKLKLKIPEIMIVAAIAIGVLAPSIVQMGLF